MADESRGRFEELCGAGWTEALNDPCTDDWAQHWTLDGLKANISHSDQGMDFHAGPTYGDDAHHAVLWTKQSFKGDVRLDYEYTRIDEEIRAVTILYIQATGSGEGPYKKDIAEWAELRREEPSMGLYFNHMNTFHISCAAFGLRNDDVAEDYIRARRYTPDRKGGLKNTDLEPDYTRTGLFETGVPHKVTVIKKGDDLFAHWRTDAKKLLCHWKTGEVPPIVEGRIGLRHMYTRGARYRDFRVSVIDE